MRRPFENNHKPEPEILDLNGKLFEVLPVLPRNQKYQLTKIDGDKIAVVILEDAGENSEFDQAFGERTMTEREKFERRYHS